MRNNRNYNDYRRHNKISYYNDWKVRRSMLGVQNTSDDKKNYKHGLSCIESEHGRTWEFPDVYAIIDGYSAKVVREWYTHVGGAPTRLQASTRLLKELDNKDEK